MEPWPNAPHRPYTPPESAIGVREAARLLRMSPDAVRALFRSGRLAGVEVSPRRWKTTPGAVRRFLEGEGTR